MKKNTSQAVSVFEFDDYRAFLRAKFAERKRFQRFFSHRFFARKAGFRTPSFLNYVMHGRRNLTLESIKKFVRGFDLSAREAAYFELLVQFNQTSSISEKQQIYARLVRLKSAGNGRKIDQQQLVYYQQWYIPVIREMVSMSDFRFDPEWIRSRLREPVSLPDVKKACALLIELGLIRQGANGRWIVTDQVLTTGPQSESVLVAQFHKQMIGRAAASIDTVAPEEREITALTAGISRRCFQQIRDMVRDFKQSLIQKIVDDTPSEQVYQINLHVFPLTATRDVPRRTV